MVEPMSLLTEFDINLFRSGHHLQLYKKLGSHYTTYEGKSGVYFAVFAPAAKRVEVICNFNYWNGADHALKVRWDGSGIWEGFIAGIEPGETYKYKIWSHHDDKIREKADPFALKYEVPPKSASIVYKNEYRWKDKKWMQQRYKNNSLQSPISIYELHIGSWKKHAPERSLNYTELADELVKYIGEMGYTHVEFLPIMEHPYYPSWGYQCTGYFAPTTRYGEPNEFAYLIDALHEAQIGVILDWVPAHFPNDEHALADFDGSALFEHPDKSKGFHPDWNSLIFNFERAEIRSFLLSSAHFWLDVYHADGLRVDAVASMLYLDYSREEGEWMPNIYGGNTYLAAEELLKELNVSTHRNFPDTLIIAEVSTAFPGVTKPVYSGGLGFDLKWMMGWMNDTLEYFARETVYRKYHHFDLSRSMTYAYSEQYLLPLSHDEVVHGKKSIVYRMPGNEWEKFANVRALYTFMYGHPGQKLLFMGNDIGQTEEWSIDDGVHWHLLEYKPHSGVNLLIRKLNHLFVSEQSMHGTPYHPDGFEWIDYSDSNNSVLIFVRKHIHSPALYFILNLTPTPLYRYRFGVIGKEKLHLLLNSDDEIYFGSGMVAPPEVLIDDLVPWHNKSHSAVIDIPPLCGLIYKSV